MVIRPEVVEVLVALLKDPEPTVRNSAKDSLARLYAQPSILSGNSSTLLSKLTNPLKTLERPIAARALFLIVLHDAASISTIRPELKTLSESSEPIARIWANKTLMLLDIADQAHMAASLPSAERRAITDKLRGLGHEDSFFGEDFTWCIQEALDWLK